MNVQKFKGLLGLAVRARQTAFGMDACRILIRSGKCGVLLLDSTAGVNTRKKSEELCECTGIPVKYVPAGLIEEATGKVNIVMGLQKGSIAEEILHSTQDDS